MPLGDLGVSSIDVLLSKLPHEFTVDRCSRNGELSIVKIFIVDTECSDTKASADLYGAVKCSL